MENKVILSTERYHELYDAYGKYVKLESKNVVITKHTHWGNPDIETITTIDEVTLKMLIEFNKTKGELIDSNEKYDTLNKKYVALIQQFDNNKPWYKRIFK